MLLVAAPGDHGRPYTEIRGTRFSSPWQSGGAVGCEKGARRTLTDLLWQAIDMGELGGWWASLVKPLNFGARVVVGA